MELLRVTKNSMELLEPFSNSGKLMPTSYLGLMEKSRPFETLSYL